MRDPGTWKSHPCCVAESLHHQLTRKLLMHAPSGTFQVQAIIISYSQIQPHKLQTRHIINKSYNIKWSALKAHIQSTLDELSRL